MASAGKSIDVAHVAGLARLKLDDAARERLQKELASIVGYVDQLCEADVSGVEPLAHAAPLLNVLRDDKALDSFPREAMLANAPDTVDRELVKVKQVLPGEEMA